MAPPPTEFEVEQGRGARGDRHAAPDRRARHRDRAGASSARCSTTASAATGVVLDLAGLEFIDSTGLRVIVRGAEAARRDGWELRLRHGPPAVQRVFEIAGVLGALPFDVAVTGTLQRRAVGVAQLVELLVVVQVVAGSSPVAHPS